MNQIINHLKALCEAAAELHEQRQENLTVFLESVAGMTDERKAELQRLLDRAYRLDSAGDLRSFTGRVHEYAARVADGEPARALWAEWCAVREKEELAAIESMNQIYKAAAEKVLKNAKE